jgi:hypothetical protein
MVSLDQVSDEPGSTHSGRVRAIHRLRSVAENPRPERCFGGSVENSGNKVAAVLTVGGLSTLQRLWPKLKERGGRVLPFFAPRAP